MDMKGTVDVSCYLCFEATGDSESPSDPAIKDPNIACRIPICDNDDDDDAQSCCYDTSDQSLINSDELLINGYESDEDEVEVCVYGTTTYKEEEEDDDDDDDCEMQKQKKMRLCGDSSAEKIDEREKNRLFWEACLAS